MLVTSTLCTRIHQRPFMWRLSLCRQPPAPHTYAIFSSPPLLLQTFFARTHLGHLLHAGDTAVGYDVANANLVSSDLELAMHKVGAGVCWR